MAYIAGCIFAANGLLGLLLNIYGIDVNSRKTAWIRGLGVFSAVLVVASGVYTIWSAIDGERGAKRTAEHIEATITGGDSYAFLVPHVDALGRGMFDLWHDEQTKYPVYDLTIRAVDGVKRLREMSYSHDHLRTFREAFAADTQTIRVGTVGPGANELNVLQFDPEQSPAWGFEFVKRNGHYRETAQLRRVGDMWLGHVRVTRFDEHGHEEVLRDDNSIPNDGGVP